jgi:hypothetical protein
VSIWNYCREALAEARAGRIGLWDKVARPALREQGKTPDEIASLFETQTKEGQDFAYGLAEDVRNQLLAEEAEERKAEVDQAQPKALLIEDDLVIDSGEPDFH